MKSKLKPHYNTTKFTPFFKASMQPNATLEMLVYTEIGETYDGTGVTATTIKQQLDQSQSYDRISVRINSPGGDCFEGTAICNLLKSSGKPVDVYIDGVAASSASIVAMAGTTIEMANNSIIMIHNAWTLAVGDSRDMRKMADTLDVVSGAIAQTYVDRTGNTMKVVQAMMDAETWLSAKDALAKGFCTSIADQPVDRAANAMARSFKALKQYKNVPASLRNDIEDEACQCDCEECSVDGECSKCSNPDCEDPGCIDCPMQTGTQDSNLSQYEARLAIIRLGHSEAMPSLAS